MKQAFNQTIQTPLRGLMLAIIAALALVAGQASASSQELAEYVDKNTQRLVEKLNENKGLYEEDPEAFYEEMDEALTGFVDFRRIAARVMGRYARQTTPEQRDEFVARFKRSLFDAYAQALVSNSEGFSIEVDQAEINPRDDSRASVGMIVTSDSGNRYQVSYSMHHSKNNGDWLVENVIVEGVNIGLAFRDRFAQEMESRRGDIDAVIDNWGDAVASLKLEEEVGSDTDGESEDSQ
ncbi:phospholipid transport system substrate-binding protein [Marinobacter daqiaonensis]|uniref:Phospholipid transport system substrate-binding protein n=1 Tax=Marinobacter daqiaonensis TaxID=650891 RepID=A0A1I6HBQ5_9GAMM|nr:ABC transporter substrate-binding protein [Marinobacter daqiaonensis]SFR51801.1 phospholipid transport system substrate-binding protein [Marinobacter daqiaonensis]